MPKGGYVTPVRKRSFSIAPPEYVVPKVLADKMRKHMQLHNARLMQSCLGVDAGAKPATTFTIKYDRRGVVNDAQC